MRREFHVRFCEGGGVRLPSATRLVLAIPKKHVETYRRIAQRAGKKDPRMANMDPKSMPFDVKRMVHGGFKVLVDL